MNGEGWLYTWLTNASCNVVLNLTIAVCVTILCQTGVLTGVQRNNLTRHRKADLKSGVNFINVLLAAIAPVDPKSVKRYWRLDWILTLLGATGVKAAWKFVGEIEPRGQFHQCSMSSFWSRKSQKRKKLTNWQTFLRFWDPHV